jgi:activating signal cointegrator complex subunit 2
MLPAIPTTQALNSLIPTIQSTLQRYVSSTTQNDSETYIATYAKHRAYSTLQSIVWGTDTKIPEEIAQLTLLIAQRTTRPIAIHTLIDLSIVYANSYLAQLQRLFQAQYNLYPLQLAEAITNDVVPTFTRLLASSDVHQALASKRKISEAIVSFLRACSPIQALIRPFALSKDFILAIASLYDAGLTSIAKSYGGYPAHLSPTTDDADDWPRIWIQTKIALIDSFHIVLTALLDGVTSQPSEVENERIFDTLFALLDLRVPPPSTTPPTPFLDMPLIADYQHAYNLSEKLPSILPKIPIRSEIQD